MMEEQKYFKQLYGKNEHIIGAGQKVKDLTEKHLNDRRKSFQDKIKKLHENIKFIESEKVEKFNELENKLVFFLLTSRVKYMRPIHSIEVHLIIQKPTEIEYC